MHLVRLAIAAGLALTLTACGSTAHDMSSMPGMDMGGGTSTTGLAASRDGYTLQHVHAVLGADGTWTAATTPITGGAYRMYAAFIPGAGPAKGHDLVLSTPFTVPGPTTADGQVTPRATASVAGYEITVGGSATTGTGMLHVTITKDGKPATDLQPYLDTFAHLTAIREGDLAFAHMHPLSDTNGVLMFHTEFPEAGAWRLFLQFQSGGVLHTAQLAVTVN